MLQRILTIEQIKQLENGHYVWINPQNPDFNWPMAFAKEEDGLLSVKELFRKQELKAEYMSPMPDNFWTWEELEEVSDIVQFLDDKGDDYYGKRTRRKN